MKSGVGCRKVPKSQKGRKFNSSYHKRHRSEVLLLVVMAETTSVFIAEESSVRCSKSKGFGADHVTHVSLRLSEDTHQCIMYVL